MSDTVLSLFRDICAIPHPSRGEGRLAAWIVARAEARGIEAGLDAAGNVILRVPASEGLGGAPGVILQAHLDMVCQAAEGVAVDFSRDPIRPVEDPRRPGWLRAAGTSLGADDGIGVALALAAVEDSTLLHGPLECLFTVNEEDGMDGARGLDPGGLMGRYLVNLDGEEAGDICVGCAGAARVCAHAEFGTRPPQAESRTYELRVSGLAGGHTGCDIHLGRGNALRVALGIAMRGLEAAGALNACALSILEGGVASNAIPQSARLVLTLHDDHCGAFTLGAEAAAALVRRSLGDRDPGARISIRETERPARAIPAPQAGFILSSLEGVPEGVLSVESGGTRGTRTSCCLSLAASRAPGESLVLDFVALARSSSEEEKSATAARAEAAFSAFGCRTTRPADSPAWAPRHDSELLALARKAARAVFARESSVTTTHGGLECAVLGAARPDWSMVAIGPTVRNPHSPAECLDLASVETTWRFLVRLVESVALEGLCLAPAQAESCDQRQR